MSMEPSRFSIWLNEDNDNRCQVEVRHLELAPVGSRVCGALGRSAVAPLWAGRAFCQACFAVLIVRTMAEAGSPFILLHRNVQRMSSRDISESMF